MSLLIFGFTAIFSSMLVYLLYFLLVYTQKNKIAQYQTELKSLQKSNSSLPNITVVVSTFNESKVIGRKIENITELNYPLNKIEVLVIDDNSSDGTAEIAEAKIKEKMIFGRVIRNSKRLGLNRSLNLAMAQAKNPLICITDSDVTLEKEALRNSVTVLEGFRNAGGVTGKIHPVFEGNGIAQKAESSYRGFYHQSMLSESSLHSAFPGNGPLIVFNKNLVPSSIPVYYGSTDGNIAMNIIRSGFRFIYIPNATVFEPVPESVSQQRLQKIRRAKRLIQVFLRNSSVLFDGEYGRFGTTVFPLKYAMMILCPILLLLGSASVVVSIILSQNIVLYSLFTGGFAVFIVSSMLSKGLGDLISSFVLHQFYLVAGLFSSLRKSVYWKTIERN